jgi:hypothetical protein
VQDSVANLQSHTARCLGEIGEREALAAVTDGECRAGLGRGEDVGDVGIGEGAA